MATPSAFLQEARTLFNEKLKTTAQLKELVENEPAGNFVLASVPAPEDLYFYRKDADPDAEGDDDTHVFNWTALPVAWRETPVVKGQGEETRVANLAARTAKMEHTAVYVRWRQRWNFMVVVKEGCPALEVGMDLRQCVEYVELPPLSALKAYAILPFDVEDKAVAPPRKQQPQQPSGRKQPWYTTYDSVAHGRTRDLGGRAMPLYDIRFCLDHLRNATNSKTRKQQQQQKQVAAPDGEQEEDVMELEEGVVEAAPLRDPSPPPAPAPAPKPSKTTPVAQALPDHVGPATGLLKRAEAAPKREALAAIRATEIPILQAHERLLSTPVHYATNTVEMPASLQNTVQAMGLTPGAPMALPDESHGGRPHTDPFRSEMTPGDFGRLVIDPARIDAVLAQFQPSTVRQHTFDEAADLVLAGQALMLAAKPAEYLLQLMKDRMAEKETLTTSEAVESTLCELFFGAGARNSGKTEMLRTALMNVAMAGKFHYGLNRLLVKPTDE
jgi:hypothetical protein